MDSKTRIKDTLLWTKKIATEFYDDFLLGNNVMQRQNEYQSVEKLRNQWFLLNKCTRIF